jgi:hypothetical protein
VDIGFVRARLYEEPMNKTPKNPAKMTDAERGAMKAHHPQPFGTKAQQNKGKRVQPAFQKRNNQKGR